MPITRKKIIFSLMWKYLQQCSSQVVGFVIGILLARLLLPEDYGVIAIVMVFIAMSNVFISSGLPTALIQKIDADDLDFNSVFWVSMSIAVLMYILLFLLAPFIAKFYNNQILIPIIRVLGLTLFTGVFVSMQNVVVAKKLLFKKLFYMSILLSVPIGIFSILLAFRGFGVWALVYSSLLSSIFTFLFMQLVIKWRPKLIFSFSRAKILFTYGWKLLLESIISLVVGDIHKLIIGRLSQYNLGLLNKGESFPKLIVGNVNSTIQSVMFPVYSDSQNDLVKLKQLLRRSLTISTFVMVPIMTSLFLVSSPLVSFLLGEKWLPSVVFLQLFCFSYAFWHIHTNNLAIMNSLGRSDLYLKVGIVKQSVWLVLIIVSLVIFKSMYLFFLTMIITTFFSSYVNMYPNKKLLDYGCIEQAKDMLPYYSLSLLVGLCVSVVGFLNINDVSMIFLQVILFFGLYLLIAKLMKFECMEYIIVNVKNYFNRDANEKR